MQNRRQISLSDLPAQLPVFPLSGALLFPRWNLPLNIFEPRYLNMIDDAMATHKLIGMVQPTGGDRSAPNLAAVGCVGEIASYSETKDGRYLISLSGIIRFEIMAELDKPKPYRQVHANYTPFKDDLNAPSEFASPNHDMIVSALKPYAASKGLDTDWSVIASAEMETLISALSAGCPFDDIEKQVLLETENLQARAETLIQLMQLNTTQNEGNGGPSLQ